MFVFLLLKEKKKAKKIDNWNFWFWEAFGFFWSKNGRFVTHNCFSENVLLKPLFIVFWGARFLDQVVKKGKIWTPTPPKNQNLADN